MSITQTLPDGTTQRLRGEAIREYASEVFRRHNGVSSTLLAALPYLEDQSPDVAEQLLLGEEAMNEACGPIDAVAVRYRDGASVDLGDQLAFARALEACERETARMERMLATLESA